MPEDISQARATTTPASWNWSRPNLAAQMKHQRDQDSATYEQDPWVPGNPLAHEAYPTGTGSTGMGESPSDQDVDDEDQTVDDVHGMTEFMSDRQRRRVGVPGTTRGLTAE